MELGYINEFIELASSLNFTETAEKLHLAQPTLSKHVSTLENELGAKLLNRSSSHVELTEEGWYFLGVAHNIVHELDHAREILSAMRQRKPLYIDGNFTDAMVSGVLASALASMDPAQCSAVFNHDRSKPHMDLLIDGTIDLLVDVKPACNLVKHGIEEVFLFSRPMVVIVSKEHPLAGQTSVSIRDLAQHTLVRLMGGICDTGWQRIEALFATCGLEPRYKSLPVQSMIEGITTMPRDCALLYPGAAKELKYLSAAQKVSIPLEVSETQFATYAMYRTSNKERVAPFLDILARVSKELDGNDAAPNR